MESKIHDNPFASQFNPFDSFTSYLFKINLNTFASSKFFATIYGRQFTADKIFHGISNVNFTENFCGWKKNELNKKKYFCKFYVIAFFQELP